MVLSMPSPYKHPATGVYWYRQRVPARLKSTAKGKSVTVTIDGHVSFPTIGEEIKVSLRTKSPAEAKRLALEAQGEFDRIWLSHENGPVSLTLKQIVALSGEVYHVIKRALEDDPGEAGDWLAGRRQREADSKKLQRSPHAGLMIDPGSSLRARLGSWVDGTLAKHHLTVTDETYQRLLVEFDRAAGDIAALLEKRLRGDFSPDTVAGRFPSLDLGAPMGKAEGGGVSITALFPQNALRTPWARSSTNQPPCCIRSGNALP